MIQGSGFSDAQQIATNSLYTILQQQSLLLSMKEILGNMFFLTLALAIISRFISFHKMIRMPVVKTGEDTV